jgi:hypothetical protein
MSVSDKKLTKSMPEVKLAISTRIRSLVDETAATIKDLHQRELFKSSILGEAHPEPGTHESPEVGVPEHMEPGMHEQMAQPAPADPVGDAAPTSAALGVPGGQLDGDMAPENGTLDICPLCQNEDTPETCTCLSGGMMKNDVMGYGPTGAGQSMIKAQACKKCSGMHKALDKCGEMKPGKPAVKKALPPMDPKANSNKPNQGQTLDQRAGLSAKASANAAAGPRKPPLSKAVDSPATVPDPKAKALPKEKTKAVTGAGGQKTDKVKDNEKGLKKGDVPMAKPPSGKVPGGTQAPPMATNTSKPGIGAAPKAPKPPPAPGMAKAALPANKQQMQQHMLNASATAAKAPAAAPKPGAMPGHLQGFLDEKQNRPANLTHPTNPSRANDLAGQIPGGSFQPPPAPKLQGMKAPAPAAPAPKRSLFSTLFGAKK